MRWQFWKRDDFLDRGEVARRIHSRWLTRALAGEQGRLPRIPVRRVSEGGFDAMMARTRGRAAAERWWLIALNRVDIEPTE